MCLYALRLSLGHYSQPVEVDIDTLATWIS